MADQQIAVPEDAELARKIADLAIRYCSLTETVRRRARYSSAPPEPLALAVDQLAAAIATKILAPALAKLREDVRTISAANESNYSAWEESRAENAKLREERDGYHDQARDAVELAKKTSAEIAALKERIEKAIGVLREVDFGDVSDAMSGAGAAIRILRGEK